MDLENLLVIISRREDGMGIDFFCLFATTDGRVGTRSIEEISEAESNWAGRQHFFADSLGLLLRFSLNEVASRISSARLEEKEICSQFFKYPIRVDKSA